MSEIDERLQQAMDELAGVQLIDNTWQEAEAVRREITGIIQGLHRDLCAEASSACQQWGAKCQGLEAERDELRQQADRLRTAAIEGYGVMEKAEEAIHYLEQQLATVKALVPEAEWLEMIVATTRMEDDCTRCPYRVDRCDLQCNDAHKQASTLAARIRAWRGDGDGREERDEMPGQAQAQEEVEP